MRKKTTMNPFEKKEEVKEESKIAKATPAQLAAMKMAKQYNRENLPKEMLEMLKPSLSSAQQKVYDAICNSEGKMLHVDAIAAVICDESNGELVWHPNSKIGPLVGALVKKGYIYRVDGAKGIYSLEEFSVRDDESNEGADEEE